MILQSGKTPRELYLIKPCQFSGTISGKLPIKPSKIKGHRWFGFLDAARQKTR
jgi:hypothetical protein